MKSRTKTLVFVLLLLFYASLALYQIKLPAADDLGRHIMNGEMILQGHFNVLNQNVYSYTEPDSVFFNHHWLSGVVFYLLQKAVGFPGLVIFKVLVLLATFSLLFLTALKKANFWLVSFFSIPTILLLVERSNLRPEMFSYLFIAVFLYLLIDSEEHPESKKIFWLVPLQILWVNLHIFFVIGPLMILGFLLEKSILNWRNISSNPLVRKLSLLLVLLAAASLINPHGIRGALLQFPLNVVNNSPILISEDQPLFTYFKTASFWGDTSLAIFMPLAFLLMASFFINLKRKPLFYFLAAAGTAAISFMNLRGVSFFSLMFLPIISANCTPLFERIRDWFRSKEPHLEKALGRALISVLGGVLLFLIFFSHQIGISTFGTFGIGLTPRSNGAAMFFKEQGLKGPIFNDADIGSYLIYNLYPQERVFVDNRFGDAYSSEFFSDVYLPMIADEDTWQAMQEKYQLNSIFFFQYDAVTGGREFLSKRMNDPDWALVYADTYNLIFVRNTPENQDVISKFKITKDNAAERLDYLLKSKSVSDRVAAADIFFLLGRDDLAMSEYFDIVTKWPGEDSVWMVMAEIELQKNAPSSSLLAAMYLGKSLSLGRRTAEVYSFLGLAYLRLEQLEKGKQMLEEALRINPDRADAKSFLAQLAAHLQAQGIQLSQ